MLLEKLAIFVDGKRELSYVQQGYQMEIWLSDREELPVVVSALNNCRYIISLGDFVYELQDEERAYRYIVRVFSSMNGTSIDYRLRHGLRGHLADEKH